MTGWHNASVDATLTLWKRFPMLTVPMLHRSEVNRMTSEKVSAFTDGAVAAQREMMRLGVALISRTVANFKP